MQQKADFEMLDFVPYLLNQAAERTSRDFERYYKTKHQILRTEWRVIFHLGRYGALTAKDICQRARIHKTKVSRAVSALDQKRLLTRTIVPDDRRQEMLALTKAGERVFDVLSKEAKIFNAALLAEFSEAEQSQMKDLLAKLAQL